MVGSPVLRTDFQSCLSELVQNSPKAQEALSDWTRNYRFRDVVPFVKDFVHTSLFTLDVKHFEGVLARTEHALGELQKSDELQVVEKLRLPPIAVQDIFHSYVERKEALPTWDEFYDDVHGPRWEAAFISPAWQQLTPAAKKYYGEERIRKAFRWRLGRMYYSALREVDVLIRMRHEYEIHLKYHIFADVRLRSDFWVGRDVVAVYLDSRYREHKVPTRKIFLGAKPPVRVHSLAIPNFRQRGELYRVDRQRLNRLAECLRSDPAKPCRCPEEPTNS